jgi:hypothetical protein
MSQERITFEVDIDELLPGDEFKIGKQVIVIRPLGLLQYKTILGRLRTVYDELNTLNINGENIRKPESVLVIADLVMTKFPDVLEEATNISTTVLDKLPLEIILALIDKCLEVNLRSKESFLKNWNSLIKKITIKLPETDQGKKK